MNLELTDDEAVVFFEWLSRLDEQNAFPCDDQAEELVLWALHGQLEKVLKAQFDPSYQKLVEQARARVRANQKAG